MKPILLFLLIILTSFTPDESETHVYICKSKGGKKYHLTEDCRGLKSCIHKVEKVPLKKAKAGGKTLCAWED